MLEWRKNLVTKKRGNMRSPHGAPPRRPPPLTKLPCIVTYSGMGQQHCEYVPSAVVAHPCVAQIHTEMVQTLTMIAQIPARCPRKEGEEFVLA